MIVAIYKFMLYQTKNILTKMPSCNFQIKINNLVCTKGAKTSAPAFWHDGAKALRAG